MGFCFLWTELFDPIFCARGSEAEAFFLYASLSTWSRRIRGAGRMGGTRSVAQEE